MKIGTFDWKRIGVFPVYKSNKQLDRYLSVYARRKVEKNLKAYIDWALKVLAESTDDKPVQKETQWNACAIYMNAKNIEFLHRCFTPMEWLNYSPTTDDSLEDDQFAINTDEVLTPCQF